MPMARIRDYLVLIWRLASGTRWRHDDVYGFFHLRFLHQQGDISC